MSPRSADTARRERLDLYRAVAAGHHTSGDRGTIAFVVSTDDLTESKGDLYVALALAVALVDDGWGVMLWPTDRYGDELPARIDIAVVMIESYVPGYVDRRTRLVGWVRNWAEVWAGLPYLHEFDALWCSSTASAELLGTVFGGEVRVVPIATDPIIFAPVAAAERAPGVATTANFWGVERGITGALRAVAAEHPVAWFGRNGTYLENLGDVDHRGLVEWGELNRVYSEWAIVLDDLIPAAAAYGNQNSRLFDALACGAFVVTNESRGLAELGLDDVATYATADDLARVVRELLADPPTLTDRAQRLSEHVRRNHSGTARAAILRDHLLALRPSAATPAGRRDSMLRWAASEREKLRAQRAQLDQAQHDLLVLTGGQVAALQVVESELAEARGRNELLRREIAAIRSSRSYRFARRIGSWRSRFGGGASAR